jgi:hypothetical protein
MIRSIKDTVKESAGNGVESDGIFRTQRRQQAERRVSTASSLHIRAARSLVIAVSVAGMLAAAAALVLIWSATADTPLPERINESIVLGVHAPSARSGVSGRMASG